MGFYITRLGETVIVLEAPASGAFAKGASEVEADPKSAMTNIVRTIKQVSEALGRELMPAVRATGAALEVAFNVRADSYGVVMVSESVALGQFQVTVKLNPPPPMRPPPPGAPGAPPPGAIPGPPGGPPPGHPQGGPR